MVGFLARCGFVGFTIFDLDLPGGLGPGHFMIIRVTITLPLLLTPSYAHRLSYQNWVGQFYEIRRFPEAVIREWTVTPWRNKLREISLHRQASGLFCGSCRRTTKGHRTFNENERGDFSELKRHFAAFETRCSIIYER